MTTDDTRDRLAAEDVLANALYVAVVNPDTIWWDDLTPEMQDGWRRGAKAAALSLADAPDEGLDVERLAARLTRWLMQSGWVRNYEHARAEAESFAADVLRAALDRLNEEGAG